MTRLDAIHAVAERLRTIENCGNVIEDIGNPVSEADRKTRFAVGGAIRAWEVTCEGSRGEDLQAAACQRTYDVVSYGYFSFANDGTREADVQTLMVAIEDLFDPIQARTFDGQFSDSEPIEINGPKIVPLAGMAVYGVIMTCRIKDYPRY